MKLNSAKFGSICHNFNLNKDQPHFRDFGKELHFYPESYFSLIHAQIVCNMTIYFNKCLLKLKLYSGAIK